MVTQLTAYQGEILAYLHSLMPGNASVNDVLQRVNLVIWKKRSSYKKDTNFRAWAFSIARWEVRAFFKANKRKSWLIFDDELALRVSNTMQGTMEDNSTHDIRTTLEMCINKLKPDERELITHRYYSDHSLKDYAESNGRSVGGIKVTLFRIRATLKRCIENHQAIQKATQHP